MHVFRGKFPVTIAHSYVAPQRIDGSASSLKLLRAFGPCFHYSSHGTPARRQTWLHPVQYPGVGLHVRREGQGQPRCQGRPQELLTGGGGPVTGQNVERSAELALCRMISNSRPPHSRYLQTLVPRSSPVICRRRRRLAQFTNVYFVNVSGGAALSHEEP